MEAARQDLYNLAQELRDHVIIHDVSPDDPGIRDMIRRMEVCVNILVRHRDMIDPVVERERYMHVWVLVFQVLVGPIAKAKLHGYGDHAHIRSLADRVFQKYLRIPRIQSYMRSLPGKIFAEFCKGITYFVGEPIEEPQKLVYHRRASCGASDQDYLHKFAPSSLDTPQSTAQKVAALRKCYLERMAFNDIYKALWYQDIGHLLELKRIERLLDDYHHGHYLNPRAVQFEQEVFPTRFEIINHTRKHGMTIQVIETYEKKRDPHGDAYEEEIQCSKIILKQRGNTHLVKTFRKVQTWQAEMPWILML